jgi:cytochrome P450
MAASRSLPGEEAPVRYDPLVGLDDPYPVYRRLRDEAPVYLAEARDTWVLSRFDDVQAMARDWATFASGEPGGNDIDDTYRLFEPAGDLAGSDPPTHTRLRAVLHTAFRPSEMRARFEPLVRPAAARLIDRFADHGRADFARELARPLPAQMVCSWLGFPEEDHPQLIEWFGHMLDRVPGRRELPANAVQARDDLRAYVADAAEERRTAPREDLLSVLVEAQRDVAMSTDEMLGLALLLFLAGITTTAGLISNTLLHLDRFPDQRALLQREPERMPTAIEEFLRFDSPIQALARTTTREVEVRGTAIPKNARVAMILASANRDERRWPDPDRLDIAREPARHVAFGEGIHHCVGAPLARLEAAIAFKELFKRIPTYRVSGPIVRVSTPTDRALESLPVEF